MYTKTKLGVFVLERLKSWKREIKSHEIFHEDYVQMGTSLGRNLMMLHMRFPDKDDAEAITLVHMPSGQRLRISFTESDEELLSPEEQIEILQGKKESTGSKVSSLPTSAMPTSILGDEELSESLQALMNLGGAYDQAIG